MKKELSEQGGSGRVSQLEKQGTKNLTVFMTELYKFPTKEKTKCNVPFSLVLLSIMGW